MVLIYRKSDNEINAGQEETSNNIGELDLEFPPRDDAEKAVIEDAPQFTLSPQTDTARAIAEIDNVLRAMCSVDSQGKGICESCPYRDHFFGDSELRFSEQCDILHHANNKRVAAKTYKKQ